MPADLIGELEELVRCPGVSGFEAPIRKLIASKLRGFGKTREDDMGNLILEMGPVSGKKVVLIAHMDELGLLVSKINDDGSLSIRKIGGIDDRTLVSRIFEIETAKGKVQGVIGIKPPHLMEDREEMKKTVPSSELRVDIGTTSKKETEKLGIKILDPMVIRKEFEILNRKVLVSRGIDDRFGCLALIEVLRRLKKSGILNKLKMRLILVWSTQEEIGLRGAQVIAHSHRPDYVIAVDSCSSTDCPGLVSHLAPAYLGKGPGLRMVDNRAIASPKFRELVEKVAKKNRIPVQLVITGGGTDGAAIQTIGCQMIPIGLPLRYTHSTVECIHLDDLDNLIKLIIKIVEELNRKK
jgi:putative aminopeptidase FrvX